MVRFNEIQLWTIGEHSNAKPLITKFFALLLPADHAARFAMYQLLRSLRVTVNVSRKRWDHILIMTMGEYLDDQLSVAMHVRSPPSEWAASSIMSCWASAVSIASCHDGCKSEALHHVFFIMQTRCMQIWSSIRSKIHGGDLDILCLRAGSSHYSEWLCRCDAPVRTQRERERENRWFRTIAQCSMVAQYHQKRSSEAPRRTITITEYTTNRLDLRRWAALLSSCDSFSSTFMSPTTVEDAWAVAKMVKTWKHKARWKSEAVLYHLHSS